MNLLAIVGLSALLLTIAYWTYGVVLGRLFRLDRRTVTPAQQLQDDVDYMPLAPSALMGQHFSAIAAAGPIVGPILAGIMFGWLPALLWILVGAILVGGVHDFAALTASIRHRARSVAEVVRCHMSPLSYLLFLAFVWLALVYIIVAFTDITASSFVGQQTLENGQVVRGGGIATSSLLYLALPIMMGLLLRFGRWQLWVATIVFVPLIGVAIWVGQYAAFDLGAIIRSWRPSLSVAEADQTAHKAWDVILLAYCFVASVVPVWLLLQPRGHLGGYFLYIALIGGALGLVFGGQSIEFPAFRGWSSPRGEMLFPMLFITIACGACSGFHALIASGTTSKQLRYETDARLIGYGTMLLEGMVAIVSLCCVMILATNSPLLENPKPNFIYAQGIGSFLQILSIPAAFGVSFALMAFTTFVYDTLDVCTRLGRFIVQELTGLHGRTGRWLGTGLTAGAPLFFLLQTSLDPETGKVVPVWRTFWSLFGASNQLLAALTLLSVTVWLWKTRRARWVWIVTGLPMVWMYAMSTWALVAIINGHRVNDRLWTPVPCIAMVLVLLAAVMLGEAIRVIVQSLGRPPAPQPAYPSMAPSYEAGTP